MDLQAREQQWATDMRAAQAGSREAYLRLLTDISSSFRQFAAADLRRFGLQVQDVEDVLQDILLAVHLKRHTWRPDHPFTPWLRAIARHKMVDFVRGRVRHKGLPIEDFPNVSPVLPVEPVVSVPMHRLLDDLPRRQRQVVEELGLGGATVADTAAKLNMSPGAVYVAFHRGLARLVARFQAERS